MTNEQLEAMREWVRAEIVLAIEKNNFDGGGMWASATIEQHSDYTDQAFEFVKNTHKQ